jgi:hypothetical protein
METATHFHNQISHAFLPEVNRVFHDTAAFDTTDDVLNHNSALCNGAVIRFLFWCEFSALWLLDRSRMLDTGQLIAQKAEIIQEFTSIRKRVGCREGSIS